MSTSVVLLAENMATNDNDSYLDTAKILADDFSPTAYANSLVHATNNASDTPLDLSTPLSRVLFDVQEVDTRIDTLTTKNADSIISHTQTQAQASGHVLEELESQVGSLKESYERLEREVGERWEQAEQVRMAAERMVRTLRLGRSVQRALALGRQLQGLVEEVAAPSRGGERSMVPAAHALLGLRELFSTTGKGGEAEGLGKVQVVTTLRNDIITPAERTLLSKAQQTVREFSMSSLASSQQPTSSTYKETEDTKARATHALHTLYLLSPTKPNITTFTPTLLISTLQSYLQTALTSSLASLSRALATLPTLDRTLLEISARCQNIVALEALLSTTTPPRHPYLIAKPAYTNTQEAPTNLLTPLLNHLDTSSLPSYFWRSMAGQMSPRVQEILNKGGVSARTLRTNRDRVREAVRECVERGSRLPQAAAGTGLGKREGGGNWEREAAVMVGGIVGPLGR